VDDENGESAEEDDMSGIAGGGQRLWDEVD